MEVQHGARMQHHVVLGQYDRRDTTQQEFAAGAQLGEPGLLLRGLDRLGVVAVEAEQDGGLGAVPGAGGRQRSIQIDADTADQGQRTETAKVLDEPRGGSHRPHRVRARRADADREQVEHADGHSAGPYMSGYSGNRRARASTRAASAVVSASGAAMRAATMTSATSSKSSGWNRRSASAGVPMRNPEETIGGRGSNGTALRLTVIPIAARRSSPCWPSRAASRRSTSTRCTSVPPVSTVIPA